MKKVLIFSLTYDPFIGGAEVALKEITDRVPDVEFHMVTARFDSALPKVEKIRNILVHRIGLASVNPDMKDLKKFPLHFNKYLFQILAAWKAEALHTKHHYDGIWAMMAHTSGIPAGIFKGRHPDVKYLLTLQEGDPPEQIERMMRPVVGLFRNGFMRADVLQAISTFLLSWGKRMGFEGDARVIPNGVDTKRFGVPVTPAPLPKKVGDVFLVTTSRLVYKNAVDDVIRALPLLPENIQFIVYGTGPCEEELKALAQNLNVQHRVRFMGHLSQVELPAALAACNIFIRPSRSEGMGNSFIEAMAAGLPVIATQEGGIADFLFDAKRNPDKEATGWAVDKNNPVQIAEAVQDILRDAGNVKRTTAAARTLALSSYDWNRIALEMQHLFRDLLEGTIRR